MAFLLGATIKNTSIPKSFDMTDWLALSFAAWLLLSVSTSDIFYRTFFHIVIYPVSLYCLIKLKDKVIWKDEFIRLFLLFCMYMGISTWLVGNDPVKNDIQAVRWSIEAFLGVLAFWLWAQNIVTNPRRWGRWFLFVAFSGAFLGLLSSLEAITAGARISGLGIMGHHLQGASVNVVMLATGLFLLHNNRRFWKKTDILLSLVSIFMVFAFVVLSQSRAPQAALLGYLGLSVLIVSHQHRRLAMAYVSVAILIGLSLTIYGFVGFDVLYEQLKERGLSYRLDIWTAVIEHPPTSLIFGHGAGLDFRLTEAARVGLNHLNFQVHHPHNIWLGAFMDTGFIGVGIQAGLLALPLVAVLSHVPCTSDKLHLLALLGLFVALTLTDEYTLLVSLHPIWLIGWLPMILVWSWCRYKETPPLDT